MTADMEMCKTSYRCAITYVHFSIGAAETTHRAAALPAALLLPASQSVYSRLR